MSRLAILSFDEHISRDNLLFFKDLKKVRFINIKNKDLPSILDSIKNRYDIILIIKGDEQLEKVECTIRFYKGMDSVHGDLETTSSNPKDIIRNMIKRSDYLGVNSLGYAKNKINKIEKNYYMRNGGLWVKSEKMSKVYISLSFLESIDFQQLEFYNIIV